MEQALRRATKGAKSCARNNARFPPVFTAGVRMHVA
jgi:hypothetical protein